MDRFIAIKTVAQTAIATIFKIQYGQIYRFAHIALFPSGRDLKSNMDRFIAEERLKCPQRDLNLKSNMDRFIDT